MEQEKIKKVNVGYLLATIFIPIIVMMLLTTISVLASTLISSTVASFIIMIALLGAILYWVLGTKNSFNKKKEAKLKELDNSGFVRNHTFNSDTSTVAVDIANGKIAIFFKWNPKQLYVLPASRITKMWTDDGKTIGGTSRVSFLFIVDGIKIRVNTFVSNKIWSMKSANVLEAISKADMMVEALKAAQAASSAI